MTTIDEIDELRAELHHSYLTAAGRRSAQTRLAKLPRTRNARNSDEQTSNCNCTASAPSRLGG